MKGEDPKIGVYICHCGGNISDTVDVEKVRETVSKFGGVKIARTHEYLCSDPGQELIKEDIKKEGLNRIVVASCSPRMHLETFRKTLESAGLNKYLLDMPNIREQCSWVHDNKEKGTNKTIDLIRGAVARSRYLEPLETKKIPIKQDVLVIGGGIAGITSSLELADKGYQVYLIEKSPSIGGHMAQLSKTFPTLDCSQCILTPKMVSASQHPKIKIFSMTELTSVEGTPGNYRVIIKKRPRFIDEQKCTVCRECEIKCPIEVPSEFEEGLLKRKAVYRPFQQAVPKTYVIDSEHCLHFKKGALEFTTNEDTPHKWKFVSGNLSQCVGCCVCEYACSMHHEKTFNPTKSRIRVVRLNPFANLAIACKLCEDPPCLVACPRDALSQSEETGVIMVDEEKCNGCGWCIEACKYGAITLHPDTMKAIVCDTCDGDPQCVEWCPEVCDICVRACKEEGPDCIHFDQEKETFELDVGAIVTCTGFQLIEPEILEEYSYGLHPDIVTNLQFERLISQGLIRPSNGEVAKRVAFILCAGSRNMNEERGVEYCCKIGCMASIKQAMLLQKVVPGADPWIFYTDIRADGKGYEEFYVTSQHYNVHYVRGRVGEIIPSNDGVLVRAEDTLIGRQVEGKFDLVVLVLGIIPNSDTEELAKKLGIQVGSDGFLLERHYKLRPVDSQREGVFVAGCALGPKDVRETTLEAMAASSRVASFVGKGEKEVSPEVAYIIPEKCNGCELCISVCPVDAIKKSDEGLAIDQISCVGCGICVPKCAVGAIELKNMTEKQLMAQIGAISEQGESPKILAFLEQEIAYGAADLAGQNRVFYPANVEIIGVPSTGRISLKHILQAFVSGVDGVLLLEGHGGVFTEEALREHVIQIKKELRAYDIESLRLMSFSTTLPEYNKVQDTFEKFSARISKLGPIPEKKRNKLTEKLREKVLL